MTRVGALSLAIDVLGWAMCPDDKNYEEAIHILQKMQRQIENQNNIARFKRNFYRQLDESTNIQELKGKPSSKPVVQCSNGKYRYPWDKK